MIRMDLTRPELGILASYARISARKNDELPAKLATVLDNMITNDIFQCSIIAKEDEK